MKTMNNTENNQVDADIIALFHRFFDSDPTSSRIIDTSRGESDFRKTVIITVSDGRKYVLKLAANDFYFSR